MIQTKVAFLEGRLLSSQSEQIEKFCKLWLAGKKPFLFWSYKQANCASTLGKIRVFSNNGQLHFRINPLNRGLTVFQS